MANWPHHTQSLARPARLHESLLHSMMPNSGTKYRMFKQCCYKEQIAKIDKMILIVSELPILTDPSTRAILHLLQGPP